MSETTIHIALHGTDERTSWAAVIVHNNGTILHKDGLASNQTRAVLWALHQSISVLTKGTRININSIDKLAITTGQEAIPKWRRKGYPMDPDHKLIESTLRTLSHHEIDWVHTDNTNDLTVLAKSKAKQCYQNKSKVLCSDEIQYILAQHSHQDQQNGEHQIESTKPCETPKPKTVSTTSPRIYLYIDAITTGSLGCWSFILIDRPSKHAMICANGYRHTNEERIKIQACIEGLQVLSEKNMHIEIRSRHQKLIANGKAWSGEEPPLQSARNSVESPYIEVLKDNLKEHTITWQHIPPSNEEQGIVDGYRVAQESLNRLNEGNPNHITRRIKEYPLERLQ